MLNLKDANRGLAVDEYFALFVEEFGTQIERRDVPESTIARYRHKLPDQLLEYWMEYGWGGYTDGIFWIVNPQDYEPLLSYWLADTEFYDRDCYHVIARSAFGVLYVWGETSGYCLTISCPMARYTFRDSRFTGSQLDFGVKVFFSAMNAGSNDFGEMFVPAVRKLGRLKPDEMYGLVPALALGGSIELDNLRKVNTVEHLEFLSQLSPLRDWGFPDI